MAFIRQILLIFLMNGGSVFVYLSKITKADIVIAAKGLPVIRDVMALLRELSTFISKLHGSIVQGEFMGPYMILYFITLIVP